MVNLDKQRTSVKVWSQFTGIKELEEVGQRSSELPQGVLAIDEIHD